MKVFIKAIRVFEHKNKQQYFVPSQASSNPQTSKESSTLVENKKGFAKAVIERLKQKKTVSF